MLNITSWLTHSIYRTLLLAFILISVVPIVVISWLFIEQSMEALTAQMEQNVLQLAQSKAEEIDLKLHGVMNSTVIASHLATEALQNPLPAAEVQTNIGRYQPDQRAIWGLDNYYNTHGGAEKLGENLSNVYWTQPLEATSPVAEQIVSTEKLDTVFAGIKAVTPETQWVYMTTPAGMMRLYPWASNDHYPDNWDPREIIFYTVAEPGRNPELRPQWTPPYVDYAGAGWMVTASVPMVSQQGEFLGVMSHDITIDSLKEIALGINVLDGGGYGFLIDAEGKVIAHPAFQDSEANKGTQEETSLLTWEGVDYQGLIQQMVNGQQGLGYYTNAAGESLLVFAPVKATGWSLGISIPREQVIAPAIAMRNRAVLSTVALIGLAIALALVLTRIIHRPIEHLLAGVHQISSSGRADEIQLASFQEFNDLAEAFNDMAAKVWERETKLKQEVAEMRIEINTQRKQERLNAIVETDFFKRLEMNAARLRETVKPVPAD